MPSIIPNEINMDAVVNKQIVVLLGKDTDNSNNWGPLDKRMGQINSDKDTQSRNTSSRKNRP